MTLIIFNLLINSTFSLLSGLLVVGFVIWLFRIEDSGWKLFMLSLPFLKILYDVTRGLPVDSVLLAGLNPYSLPPRHQIFQIGAGFGNWGPSLSAVFSVRDLNGVEYASSVGDYLVIWLNQKFGTHVPLIAVTFILGVAVTLLAVRLFYACKFERRRTQDRAKANPLKTVSAGFRNVDIYITNGFSGSPFTGGLIRPYICIPQNAAIHLNADELNAVIAHELGHIRQADLIVAIAVQILGDLFWFVPGYRWLSRKIDNLREILADEWAVKNGIEPTLLASAMVKLKEIPGTSDGLVFYSAFFKKKSPLKTRVERLLGKVERASRLGWSYKTVRIFVAALVFMTVMRTTIGANHNSFEIVNPDWFEHLLKTLGL